MIVYLLLSETDDIEIGRGSYVAVVLRLPSRIVQSASSVVLLNVMLRRKQYV